jgi:tetraacyldisaccharide 4'-kinase
VDYHQPVFQDFLLPAGNLRESWKNSKRSDIVIVTKCPDRLLPHERSWFGDKMNLRPRQDLYFTAYSYSTPRAIFPSNKKKDDVRTFKQLRKSHAGILLMTGIANPAPILHFLEKSLVVHDKLFYADHHDFTNYDLHTISTHLQAVPGVEKYIIVTEKDAVKLRELEMDGNLKKALLYIPIEVKFLAKGEKPFYKRVEKFVRKAIH